MSVSGKMVTMLCGKPYLQQRQMQEGWIFNDTIFIFIFQNTKTQKYTLLLYRERASPLIIIYKIAYYNWQPLYKASFINDDYFGRHHREWHSNTCNDDIGSKRPTEVVEAWNEKYLLIYQISTQSAGSHGSIGWLLWIQFSILDN